VRKIMSTAQASASITREAMERFQCIQKSNGANSYIPNAHRLRPYSDARQVRL
jgi:hypothetical protein